MSTIYLSLGSNENDRLANLRAALVALENTEDLEVTQVSSVYQTAPVGETNQSAFLNCALEIQTSLPAPRLIQLTKTLEQRLGRVPSYRWGPRIIDIDIILAGSLLLESEELTLPHPRFRQRNFVLVPLAEIAPDACDPVSGHTVAELLAQARAEGDVELYATLWRK